VIGSNNSFYICPHKGRSSLFLRAIVKIEKSDATSPYPLSLPLFRNLERLEFTKPVTIIAGENGSGKTTLLEILSLKLNAIRIDGNFAAKSEKIERIKQSEPAFRLEMIGKPKRNFFFQAEDFIRYMDALHQIKHDALTGLRGIEVNYAGRSTYAKSLAAMPYVRTLHEIEQMYAGDIMEKSHGESFIEFFASRITNDGLYLLDEPEAALSAFNQLVILNLFSEAEKKNCQLIVSTHSPILSAYPGACIYEIRNNELVETKFEDMESISFIKAFLNNKDAYLRNL